MSEGNGVIRIGRKGRVKFSFSEEGGEFTVCVVEAFQEWVAIDDEFRGSTGGFDAAGEEIREVQMADMPKYHQAAVQFVKTLSKDGAVPDDLDPAEALDFLARLREQYDAVAHFFVPRSRRKRESPATSETASLEFSEERVETSAPSTN